MSLLAVGNLPLNPPVIHGDETVGDGCVLFGIVDFLLLQLLLLRNILGILFLFKASLLKCEMADDLWRASPCEDVAASLASLHRDVIRLQMRRRDVLRMVPHNCKMKVNDLSMMS